jgi:hypothetical protein
MADETKAAAAAKPEPRAVTYKEVVKSGAESPAATWKRIGEITGAGNVSIGPKGDATIDITGLSDAKRAQIDNLLAAEKKATKEK